MVLPTRSIAFSIAVVGFFVLSIVGSFGGLSPETCCKRALLGAVATYVAALAAVRAVSERGTGGVLSERSGFRRGRRDRAGCRQASVATPPERRSGPVSGGAGTGACSARSR